MKNPKYYNMEIKLIPQAIIENYDLKNKKIDG